jgi:hypothetical protein
MREMAFLNRSNRKEISYSLQVLISRIECFSNKHRIRKNHVKVIYNGSEFFVDFSRVTFRAYPETYFVNFLNDYFAIYMPENYMLDLFSNFCCTLIVRNRVRPFSVLKTLLHANDLSFYFANYPMHNYLNNLFKSFSYDICEFRFFKFIYNPELQERIFDDNISQHLLDLLFGYDVTVQMFKISFELFWSSIGFSNFSLFFQFFKRFPQCAIVIFEYMLPHRVHHFKCYFSLFLDFYISTATPNELLNGFSLYDMCFSFFQMILKFGMCESLCNYIEDFYLPVCSNYYGSRLGCNTAFYPSPMLGADQFLMSGGESNPGPGVFFKNF